MTIDEFKKVKENFSQGEVFTPQDLVDDMINKISKEMLMSCETTFIDPCCGNGTYLISLVKKLKEYGHSSENINSRLYGIEYNPVYISDLKKMGFQNIFIGDSLGFDYDSIKINVKKCNCKRK